PPVVLNPDPQFAARDLALVENGGTPAFLAALDANLLRAAGGSLVSRVILYVPHADGTSRLGPSVDLPASFLPAAIASADLTGNGLGDLAITAAAGNQVLVSLQTAPGVFGPATAY